MKFLVLLFSLFLVFSRLNATDEIDVKLEKVLYPCVRVLNGQGGGSGTVVYSEDREKSGEFQTFVLTNHHVIDNLIHIEKVWDNLTQVFKYVEQNDMADVEVFSYANNGQTVTKSNVKAEIIAYVKEEDIALLRLRHPFEIKFKTKILPANKHLRLFQEIYAVGCPLLEEPLFTKGEVTDLERLIENKPYIGGTADIIWGNSGGAVVSKFDDGEWYFCGIPSRGRVAQNGQFASWLGFYVTPDRIRKFISTQKLDFLIVENKTPTQCLEERTKTRKQSSVGENKDNNNNNNNNNQDQEE